MLNKLLVSLAVCLLNSIQTTVQWNEVRPEFEDNQILKIFHRPRDQIPKYQITSIKTSSHRTKREVRPVEIEIDGTRTHLSLTPVEHNVMSRNTPVWIVERDQSKAPYRLYHKLSAEDTTHDGIYYEDIERMGLLLAQYKNQQIYYDGLYGESSEAKVVKSVLEKWWRDNAEHPQHIVYGVEQSMMNISSNEPTTEDFNQNSIQDKKDIKLMDKPLEILYPKLLIVLENNYFKKLGGNVSEAVKYVGTFWNAVNLKYKKLREPAPKVKIVITGIIIEKDENTLPYIFESRNQTLDTLDSWKMIQQGGKYFKEVFHTEVDFKNYDSTVTMTNLDTQATAGLSWTGSICSDVYNIGYVQDDGSYSGIQTATHELGHMLNLPHDESEDAYYCKSFPKKDTATIMAPYRSRVKKFIWSDCSKKILAQFAWKKNAECLRHPYRS